MTVLPCLDCGRLHEQTGACPVEWVQTGEDEGIPIYSEIEMASSVQVQGFIDSHHQQCVSALQMIAQLADTGSDEHKQRFNPNGEGDGIANGWRVAEAMREIANDAVGNISLSDDVRELLIYKQAFDAMAAQMVCPKMTGLEMAKMQLGIR